MLKIGDEDAAESYADIQSISEFSDTIRALVTKRSEAYKKAFTDIGVIFATSDGIKFADKKSDAYAVNSIKEAVTYFPKVWIDASNEKQHEQPFVLTGPVKRAQYSEPVNPTAETYAELKVGRSSLFFVGDSGTTSAIHELSHRMEHTIPRLKTSEKMFLARRIGALNPDGSKGINPEEPSDIYDPEPNQEPEIGFKDHLPNSYMGKYYEGEHSWELFSTGMESLFAGKFGGFAGNSENTPDPDFKKFILGVISSSVKIDSLEDEDFIQTEIEKETLGLFPQPKNS